MVAGEVVGVKSRNGCRGGGRGEGKEWLQGRW